MEKKIDRRIQRTRQLLREAVLKAILEKGYTDLTVEDITETANLGRTTFYLHYRDKKELLLDSLDQIMNSIFEEIYSAENIRKWEQEGRDPRCLIFVHAAENPRLYSLLFDSEVSGIVISHFQEHLAGIMAGILESWQEKRQTLPHLPNPVSSSFVAGGLTGLLVWWLKNGRPYPPQEIYEMYHQLFLKGSVWAAGLGEE